MSEIKKVTIYDSNYDYSASNSANAGICGVDSKRYQELLEVEKAHEALQAECERLRQQNAEFRHALLIAAYRLKGVSLGIEKHGKNIDVKFWIDIYNEFSNDARAALSKHKKGRGDGR